MFRWLQAYFRWRLKRPLVGDPDFAASKAAWKLRRPRYRRKGAVAWGPPPRTPTNGSKQPLPKRRSRWELP